MSTLPIRVREIIRSDGSRARSLHVFCPRERASIAPERCARCGFRCPPEDGKRAPAVGCAAEEAGSCKASTHATLLLGPDAAAAHVPAGAASAQLVVCVIGDAPLGVVHRAIVRPDRWVAFPVVDANGALLGSLPSALATSADDDDPRENFVSVADAMQRGPAVRESEPLDSAISTMTSHHLRHVPIIDAEGRVTGVLYDLEVLRWIARGAPSQWW